MSIKAMKQALEALEYYEHRNIEWDYADKHAITALRQAIAEAALEKKAENARELGLDYEPAQPKAEKQEPVVWLWKNFVNGRPEYWAFDNPFPCISVGGDPLTLGEPCGWALLKPSVNGRPDRSEKEVVDKVTRLASHPQPKQPLTDEQFLKLLLQKGSTELITLTTFVGGSIQMQGNIGLLKSAKLIKEFVEAAHGIKGEA